MSLFDTVILAKTVPSPLQINVRTTVRLLHNDHDSGSHFEWRAQSSSRVSDELVQAADRRMKRGFRRRSPY